MTIGYMEVEVRIPACQSLKQKRSVVKKTVHRLRDRHNISLAEIDGANLWQKTIFGIVSIYSDRQLVEKTFYQVIDELQAKHDIEVIDYSMQML